MPRFTFVVDRADVTGGTSSAPTARSVPSALITPWVFGAISCRWCVHGERTLRRPTRSVGHRSSAEFYRSWTLSDFNNPAVDSWISPAPVKVMWSRLKWTTASERTTTTSRWNAAGMPRPGNRSEVVDGAGTSVRLLGIPSWTSRHWAGLLPPGGDRFRWHDALPTHDLCRMSGGTVARRSRERMG